MRVRSPLFSLSFFRHIVLQQGVGQQPFEPSVLGFQFLQAFGIGHAHATELATPEVMAGLGEAVPPTQLGQRQPWLRLPQKANDLLFCKSLLHVQSPVYGIGLQSYLLLKFGGTSRLQKKQRITLYPLALRFCGNTATRPIQTKHGQDEENHYCAWRIYIKLKQWSFR